MALVYCFDQIRVRQSAIQAETALPVVAGVPPASHDGADEQTIWRCWRTDREIWASWQLEALAMFLGIKV
jgi:hypothetical protein